MTGSFLCIPLMTAKDSALPPPTPCPVSLFHTGQRYFFSALMLPATGHSYSWDLFFSAIACEKKKKARLCCCIGGCESDSDKDLIYSVPKGLLVKWVGIDFLEIEFYSVIDKTFLSLSRPGGHILPLNLLVSLTTS